MLWYKSIEVQPDMYVDRKIPQKSYAPDTASIWSIDDRTPQEIMLILENMITAYKVNVLHGMTVLNAVNAIIYGFEGILKNWYVAIVKAKPTILTEWSQTIMLGEDGKPSLLSDGTPESNYIGKLISAIRDEFCGEIKDTQQIQETFLYRQRLKRLEYFHPYYTLWLRRLFELESCLDLQWKTTFIVSLPKWFIPKVQNFVNLSGSDLTWGTLYNMIIGSIIELCDEKARVRRSLKDEKTPNIDTICKQYNLPHGTKTFHPGHPASHQGEHRPRDKSRRKSKGRSKRTSLRRSQSRDSRSQSRGRRSQSRTRRSESRSKKQVSFEHKKKYAARKEVKCYGCGGPHYKSQCPKKGKIKASIKAILVNNGCQNAEEAAEQFFEDKDQYNDNPVTREETYETANDETDSDSEQFVSVTYSYDSGTSGSSEDSESSVTCGQFCECPDCKPAVKMMRPHFPRRGKEVALPEDTSEESRILMDLLQTESEAGKEILRKRYLKLLEQEKASKQKEAKKTVNPELYDKVSLARNTAQFEHKRPKTYASLHELAADHQKLISRVDRIESEVIKTKEFQHFADHGQTSEQWPTEEEEPKDYVRKYSSPALHINSIVTKNNNIRVAFYVGNKKHVTTALIDSGASVNCIHSSLVPEIMIQKSMMKTKQ